MIYGIAALKKVVDIDPRRRGGVPVLHGTRFTVAQVLAEIAETDGVEDVAKNFDLDARMIRELLNGLSVLLNRPHDLIP